MNDTYDKLTRFCLFRERCSSEVVSKLYGLKVNSDEHSKLIEQLKEEKYLDDDRFIKAFVSTKVYVKRWGKVKIRQELQMKKLDKEKIKLELMNVDDERYIENLHHLAERKWPSLAKKQDRDRKSSLFRYMAGKGYESDLIMDWMKEHAKKQVE